MVEPIKPYPMRQTALGKWEVVAEVPLRARGDNRWWCVGHMVRDDRRSVVTLLLRGENRKLVVW